MVPVSSSWKEPRFRRFTSRHPHTQSDISSHYHLSDTPCALSGSGSQSPPVKSVPRTRLEEPGDDATLDCIVPSPAELLYLSTITFSEDHTRFLMIPYTLALTIAGRTFSCLASIHNYFLEIIQNPSYYSYSYSTVRNPVHTTSSEVFHRRRHLHYALAEWAQFR